MMLVSNYILWPIASALNAHLVPEEHRKVAGHIITVSGRPWTACCLTWPQEPAPSLNILIHRFAFFFMNGSLPGYTLCPDHMECLAIGAAQPSNTARSTRSPSRPRRAGSSLDSGGSGGSQRD